MRERVCRTVHAMHLVAVAFGSSGIVVSVTQDEGSTPLVIACQNGHGEVVKTLLASGAAVNHVTTVSPAHRREAVVDRSDRLGYCCAEWRQYTAVLC